MESQVKCVLKQLKIQERPTARGEKRLVYPLRLVLGLLPAFSAYDGADPLETARAVSFLSAAIGSSSFFDCVFLDAGAFQ